MELQAQGVVTDRESLMWTERRACQALQAIRNRKLVAMPMQYVRTFC
jgi:hypothetical protein